MVTSEPSGKGVGVGVGVGVAVGVTVGVSVELDVGTGLALGSLPVLDRWQLWVAVQPWRLPQGPWWEPILALRRPLRGPPKQ